MDCRYEYLKLLDITKSCHFLKIRIFSITFVFLFPLNEI